MDYTINKYRFRKLGKDYFLTTDHGSYCFLNEDEFRNLRSKNINKKLKEKLLEREIIINENNIEEAIRLKKKRLSYICQSTSLHIIVLTLRCSMKCIYCHASSKSEHSTEFDMDIETAKKTVDFILQTPNKQITIEFQGGEPLLNWKVLKYIVKYAREKNKDKNIYITTVTNFENMDDEKMKFMIENNVSICTSLDGPKELHDHNRKCLNSNYYTVIKWLKIFKEEYEKRNSKFMINALVTLTNKSLNYPKEIVDEYVNLGIKDIHLRFLNNLGVAKQSWNNINYPVEEYMAFWKTSVEYIQELQKKGIQIRERMVKIMTTKIGTEQDPNYLDLRSPCGAAIGQLTYNYDGKIFTCDEARMIDEDIFCLGTVEEKFKDIVTCEKSLAVVNASLNDQYICDDCVYKPYCGICPVCNYAEQGNIIGKISQTTRCKIFMQQFDWVVSNILKKNL